jgi:hypothetical protein
MSTFRCTPVLNLGSTVATERVAVLHGVILSQGATLGINVSRITCSNVKGSPSSRVQQNCRRVTKHRAARQNQEVPFAMIAHLESVVLR